MSVKKGVCSAQYSWGSREYHIWEFNFDGETLLVIKNPEYPTRMVDIYINHGCTSADLEKIFEDFENPNVTVTWTSPMTEVPSQGGSGITALDVYPVGAEFTTTDTAFNPMKVWGGTWTMSPAGAKRVWTRTA